jgi:hypothetical protein
VVVKVQRLVLLDMTEALAVVVRITLLLEKWVVLLHQVGKATMVVLATQVIRLLAWVVAVVLAQ